MIENPSTTSVIPHSGDQFRKKCNDLTTISKLCDILDIQYLDAQVNTIKETGDHIINLKYLGAPNNGVGKDITSGSFLSSTIFSCFINDLLASIRFGVGLFVDDSSVQIHSQCLR